MSDIEKGFTVNDKRVFYQDGNQREAEDQDNKAQAQTPPPSPSKNEKENECQAELDSGEYRNLPPVEFGSFIISLTHAAMLHMGHISEPEGSPVETNLALARHTIDTIAMLKEKTKGNLDEQEQSLLEGILTELRMLYVQTCKNK